MGQYQPGDLSWSFALSPSADRAILYTETDPMAPGTPTESLRVVDLSDPSHPALYGKIDRQALKSVPK